MSASYRLPEVIETPRYQLRRLAQADAEPIFESYAADPAVTRYLGWRPHRTSADTRAFVDRAIAEWDRGSGFPMVVMAKTDPDRIIGMFHPQLRGHAVSYGYVLCAASWGQGCATEILRWLVGNALSHPSICRAEAFCDLDNPASARVMEKAGMTREGVLHRYFLHPNISEIPRDCLMYARVA